MSTTASDFPGDLQRHVVRSKVPGVRQFCAFAGWNLYQLGNGQGVAAKNRVNSPWCETETEARTCLEIRILEALA